MGEGVIAFSCVPNQTLENPMDSSKRVLTVMIKVTKRNKMTPKEKGSCRDWGREIKADKKVE